MKRHFPQRSSMPFAYGFHPIMEAINSGKVIEKLLIRRGLKGDNISELLEACNEKQIPVQEVPSEKLNKITSKPHQGIIAFLSLVEYQQVEHIIPMLFEKGETPLIVLLDRITDVRNIGAICRTAVCAGAHAILLPSRGSAQINEDAVKSSAGAIHQIPICRAHNLKETIRFLKDSGLQVAGVTEKANDLIYNQELLGPMVLIMGSEEDGISPEYLKLCDFKVRVPLMGPIESLNVSVATGVALYELLRQRQNEAS